MKYLLAFNKHLFYTFGTMCGITFLKVLLLIWLITTFLLFKQLLGSFKLVIGTCPKPLIIDFLKILIFGITLLEPILCITFWKT
jgi:hypothetical protein